MTFFHNFPRRPGDTDSTVYAKGMEILRFIFDAGLMLAPEILTWRSPGMIAQFCQTRFCMTELELIELPGHSKVLGDFALAISPNAVRKLRAMPVLYMPQYLTGRYGIQRCRNLTEPRN